MATDKDKNSISGNNQSSYAGTNPDKYGPPAPADEQNNPIQDEEAQNVKNSNERLSGDEAEQARNKATEGIRQEKKEKK